MSPPPHPPLVGWTDWGGGGVIGGRGLSLWVFHAKTPLIMVLGINNMSSQIGRFKRIGTSLIVVWLW